ncbi:glucosaminidase domain-containing protein [Enterococcus sp. AZ128]|uniref:glucosaminidase domain-containing protein n=1 Tax=unclassified Enterococcus TaxID=2608891 RepID=UPI003F68451C
MGSASILLNSAPVAFGAEEVSTLDNTELTTEQTVIEETNTSETAASSESTTTESTEPVEPTEPEVPTSPTEPTTPTEPTEPEEPKEPTTPTKPVKPTEPEETKKPTEVNEIKTEETITSTESNEQATTNLSVETTVPAETIPAPAEQPIVSQVESQSVTNLVPSTTETSDGAIHFEKDESVESFIKKIGEPARKIGQKDDLYASVMIAQAILESASGTSELAQAPNYNLFGIKGSHNGKSATFNTQEDTGGGNMTTIQAAFRAYENYEESFEDYAKLMKEGLSGGSDYYNGAWKSNTETYEDATKFLTGRYATDTSYNQKLNGLIKTYKLVEYDKEKAETEISEQGFAIPVENYTISSNYGARAGEFHRGLDMAAAQGEPIYASKAGTVKIAEFHYSWGNYVAIEHEGGTTTLYAHQSQYVVKAGDQVEQGQIIGYVGSTGNSTGSHLHFEVCRDSSLSQDQLIDPASVLF